MKLLQRLPGSRREPAGLEWSIFRNLPTVLLAGTILPAVYALTAPFFVYGDSLQEIAKQIRMIEILAIGTVLTHWTIVLTIAIFCVIVILMKGPAYVADRYDLPDEEPPSWRDGH